MPADRFELAETGSRSYWFERSESGVHLYGSPPDPAAGEPIARETLRSLLVWADDPDVVTSVFTGPMARDVRKNARELRMTEEMFVWHAVKLFMEVGEAG